MFRRFTLKSDDSQKQADDSVNNPVLKRESKRLFIIALAAVIVFAALFAAIFLFRPAFQEDGGGVYGNTSGNLANGGFAAESDGWIYYSNAADGFSLYKVRPDGGDKTKLNDTITEYINIYDGWVYYLAPKDKEGSEELFAELGAIKPALFKTREDGTETVQISDKATKFAVADGWIYFKDSSDKTIKKMNIDGTQVTPVTDDQVEELTVADGWIFYSNLNDENALYRIRTDGTERTKLSGEYAISINAFEGWVYYADFHAEEAFLPIYKIRMDGAEKTEIADPGSIFINVYDGWIYFSSPEDGSLHKIRTDGTGNVKISDSDSIFTNIAGSWVYYYDDEKNMYRMKTDGTENQRVD